MAFDDNLAVYFVTEDNVSNYVTEDGLDYYIFEVLPFTYPGGAKTYGPEAYKLPKEVKLNSSNIDTMSYDDRTKQLNIKFKTGSQYHFSSVDEKKFKGIRRADSAGKYFHRNVKGRYFYSKSK